MKIVGMKRGKSLILADILFLLRRDKVRERGRERRRERERELGRERRGRGGRREGETERQIIQVYIILFTLLS